MALRAAILAAAGLALALAGCGREASSARAPTGASTLRSTWRDPVGDGILRRGPAEPMRDRTDLAPASRPGRVLASIAQITDAHVRDEESPARVPFLDRLGAPFTSTFRPQEALTGQVLAAAVRAVNAARPGAVVETGDLIDNDQRNELDEALAILRGGVVNPDSGAPGYDGVQLPSDPDPAYYRPDVDPPRHPGLLQAAQRRFRSPGLRAPWYPLVGNHDLLLAGEIAPTPATQALATGDRMLVEPRPGLAVPRTEAGLSAAAIDRLLAHGLPGQTRPVPPDPRRREMHPPEVLAALRAASGHGGRGPRMDYTFDPGPGVRAIVLDTVRRDLGAGGVVAPAQVRWVARQLRRAGGRWVLLFTHQPLVRDAGAGPLLALLDHDPHVLAQVAGDTHHNRVVPRRTAAGGYWLITTASLADYPQQARMLRVRATADGGAVLETWMLDTAPDRLADIARELAYLDAQGGRPDGDAGTPLDRNVRLFVASPLSPG